MVHQSGKHNILGSFYLNFHPPRVAGAGVMVETCKGTQPASSVRTESICVQNSLKKRFHESFHCLNDPLMGMTKEHL